MLYIVLPTFFKSFDLRFALFTKTLDEIYKSNYRCIIIDDSSQKIHQKILEKNYKYNFIVQKQINIDGKSGAIRQGIKLAVSNSNNFENDFIAFQEPEKVDMINHYEKILQRLNARTICVPKRTNKSFKTYLSDQYHLEKFINKYISMKQNLNFDWTFGPIIFPISLYKYWTDCNYESYNGQIGPLFKCLRDKHYLIEVEIDYIHNKLQKEKEEEDINFMKKRVDQLNYWIRNY